MRFICVVALSCLLAGPGFSQILPPPPELAPMPDCAYAYLYSIGDLHYYSTIDCANPLMTGFGVGGGALITDLGCNGSSCKEGAIVTPTKLPAESVLSPSATLSGCLCPRWNRFAITQGRKGQVMLVEKRVAAVKLDADDPRQAVATALLDKVDGKTLLSRAAEQLTDTNSTPLEILQAQVLLERAARYMNRAQVGTQQGASTTGPLMTLSDQDFGIGVLYNLDGPSERPITDLFKAAESGWNAADADCYEFMDPAPKRYVKYMRNGVIAYFRLQQVSKGDIVHYVGQQILEEELPSGPNVFVNFTAQNVKIVQTQQHVHVLRIRTDQTGNSLGESNSREFLLYSGEILGARN